MDTSDDADSIGWSCCQYDIVDVALDVDVKVTCGDVAMAGVVMVDVVSIVVDVAMNAGGAKTCAMW
jgi:hypothetical protein